MATLPTNPSPSTRKLNPHLWPDKAPVGHQSDPDHTNIAPKPLKRLKHEDSTDCPSSDSEPEPAFSTVAVGSASGKGQNAPSIGVHITSYRKRLLDTDNLVGGSKFFVDGLRYLRLIPGDRADQITLTVEQRLCKDERTEIEIEYP